ncbi:MAG: hypothetical protein ABR990_12085 [Terracidiphilus sp.]
MRKPDDSAVFMRTPRGIQASKEMQAQVLAGVNFAVATPDPKPTSLIPPAISLARESENYRVKQTGTRLTEAEFAEVEAAASREGMSVSAWIPTSVQRHEKQYASHTQEARRNLYWLEFAQFPCTVPTPQNSMELCRVESVFSRIILTRSG